jgi:hypothetical protein
MKVTKWVGQALAVAITLGFASLGSAAIVAGFDDGNDTTNGGLNPPSVDSFKGTSGAGWNTPWNVLQNGATITANVETASPINGSGDYLHAELSTPSGTGQGVVTRRYEDHDGVLLTQPHYISFDLRVDADLSPTGTASSRYQIFDSRGSGDTSTNSTCTWIIAAYAGTSGAPTGTVAGNWGFQSGTNQSGPSADESFGAQTFIDSGIAAEAGTTYHFEVFTDPTTRTWWGSISNGVDPTYMTGLLNWRHRYPDDGTVVGNLYWGMVQDGAVDYSYAFSLDNIRIAVPEPASGALILVASVLAFCTRRRHS